MLKTFGVIVNQFSNMHLRTNHKDKMDIRTSLAFNDLNLGSMGTENSNAENHGHSNRGWGNYQ